MKLRDRVALVTGAGSGIGQASALLFAREGARVAVVDLREDAAKAPAQAIEQAGGQALAVAADVSRAADNDAAVAQTLARRGRLDVFFANAGVPQSPTSVAAAPAAPARPRLPPPAERVGGDGGARQEQGSRSSGSSRGRESDGPRSRATG